MPKRINADAAYEIEYAREQGKQDARRDSKSTPKGPTSNKAVGCIGCLSIGGLLVVIVIVCAVLFKSPKKQSEINSIAVVPLQNSPSVITNQPNQSPTNPMARDNEILQPTRKSEVIPNLQPYTAEATENASEVGNDRVSVAIIRLSENPPPGLHIPMLLVAIKFDSSRAKELIAAWNKKNGTHLPKLIVQSTGELCPIVLDSLVTGGMMSEVEGVSMPLHFEIPLGCNGPYLLSLPIPKESGVAFRFRIIKKYSSGYLTTDIPGDSPRVNNASPRDMKAISAMPPPTTMIVPKQIGKTFIPVVAGKLPKLVEAYELSITPAAQAKLIADGEAYLITEPTPIVVERKADGWVYARPTEGPHKSRLLVFREAYLGKPN